MEFQVRSKVEGMGAGDTRLTVIGFVTERAKWCGCNTEPCTCGAVRTMSRGKPSWRTNAHFLHPEQQILLE